MQNPTAARILVALLLACGCSVTEANQAAPTVKETVFPRVVGEIKDSDSVRLIGNTHPFAKPDLDQGLVDGNKRLERVILVLRRSPQQDQALAAFNERQHDPHSADYHRWLDADEFGRLYGPADADVTAVIGWLESHGLTLYHVNEGKVSLEFSGTVAQVQQAFQLEMHRYLIDRVEHIANDRDPRIPRALAPVVTGLASLSDFRPASLTVWGKYVKRDRATGRITAVQPPSRLGITPELGYVGNDGLEHEDLTPFDFATIYNVLPLWKASTPIIGSGVTIALAGGSDIALSDIATFRGSFGLPAKVPTIIHNGTDPGESGPNGDQPENTLDVEMAGAAAPGANVTLVVSADTSTTPGFELSMQYIISKQTAAIMSASYGTCELQLGASGNAFINNLSQQGATEGISIFISAGDQGSAGCDHHQSTPDEIGLQVNGVASSPYVTAVGGTDFTWSFTNTPTTTYWNATDNADGATAKGYIPEVPWNSTCVNPLLLKLFVNADGSPEFPNSEALCNEAAQTQEYAGLVGIGAGSGGVSNCTVPTGTTLSSCTGGYAKPSWQTGTGVPVDAKRDLPDVSLFSSNWVSGGINGSAILFCNATNDSNSCDYGDPNYIVYQEIGGTSAASPYMAGVMALIMQKTGARQGLANPTFYKLAALDTLASCNSSTVKSGNGCVFYDVTAGTIAQACYSGGPDCTTKNGGDQLGTLSGYTATSGYDRATGLGSVNVANLVNAWSSVAPVPSVALSPSSLAFASTTVGATSAPQVVTVKNTGSVAVSVASGGITVSGANAASFETTATTCGASLAVGASCSISTAFKPTTTGTLTARLSLSDNATGSPQTVNLTGTAVASTAPKITLSAIALSFPTTVTGSTSAEQVLTLTNTGTATVTIHGIALGGANAAQFLYLTTCGSTLAPASTCSLYVAFMPTKPGALSATLSIADTATGSPQIVALSGSATTAPSVKLSATSVTFPTNAHGTTSASQSVTLTNAGTALLDLTSIKLAGTNPADFEELTNCGPTLAAGSSCTVYVAFKPAAASAYKATLSIVDTGAGSPQSVTLTGTGK